MRLKYFLLAKNNPSQLALILSVPISFDTDYCPFTNLTQIPNPPTKMTFLDIFGQMLGECLARIIPLSKSRRNVVVSCSRFFYFLSLKGDTRILKILHNTLVC